MAMNGNEGGSAYPPNPDVKSGSCLIAGFQPLTVVHPSYWNAYKTESGATFSIDMVRLKLSFINGKGEWLSTHAQTCVIVVPVLQHRRCVMATAVTSMRIPTELNERYSRLAKETGRSRSFYVNEALQESIDRFEYEYGILKDIEDYRAGRLETYSIDEVRAHCGLAN